MPNGSEREKCMKPMPRSPARTADSGCVPDIQIGGCGLWTGFERRSHLRRPDGIVVVEGQQADAVSDADLRGVLRQRGQPHLGRGRDGELIQKVMLDGEGVGEAHLFGDLDLFERLPEAVGHRRRRPPANSDSVRTVSEVVGEAPKDRSGLGAPEPPPATPAPSSKSRAWSRSGPLPSGEGGTAVSLAVPPLFFPSLGIPFGYCWMSVSTPTMLIRPLDTVRVSPPVAQLT